VPALPAAEPPLFPRSTEPTNASQQASAAVAGSKSALLKQADSAGIVAGRHGGPALLQPVANI
jgi:hypothetical protein